jgi:hypothetical protein
LLAAAPTFSDSAASEPSADPNPTTMNKNAAHKNRDISTESFF